MNTLQIEEDGKSYYYQINSSQHKDLSTGELMALPPKPRYTLEEAQVEAKRQEDAGFQIEVVQTCTTPGRFKGSQWTIYKTSEV